MSLLYLQASSASSTRGRLGFGANGGPTEEECAARAAEIGEHYVCEIQVDDEGTRHCVCYAPIVVDSDSDDGDDDDSVFPSYWDLSWDEWSWGYWGWDSSWRDWLWGVSPPVTEPPGVPVPQNTLLACLLCCLPPLLAGDYLPPDLEDIGNMTQEEIEAKLREEAEERLREEAEERGFGLGVWGRIHDLARAWLDATLDSCVVQCHQQRGECWEQAVAGGARD